MAEETPAPRRTRVQRPEKDETEVVASPTGGQFEGDQTEDDGATEGDMPLEAARAEMQVDVDALHFEAPYVTSGTQVKDRAGRVVCFVASAHLTPAARAKTAEWIARTLTKAAGVPNK